MSVPSGRWLPKSIDTCIINNHSLFTSMYFQGSFHRKRGSKVPEAPTMHYAALQGAEENYYQVETEYQGLEKHQISSVNNYAYEYPE